MDVKKDLFLPALKAALKNEKLSWTVDLFPKDWSTLFHISSIHQVLPMIYETV